MVACLVWLLRQGSGLTFFFDEWDFVLNRSFSLHDLLRPHNGHLSLLPVLAYDVMRKIFGLSFYVPYQVLGLLVHISACTAVYFLGKRRSHLLAAAGAVARWRCAGVERYAGHSGAAVRAQGDRRRGRDHD